MADWYVYIVRCSDSSYYTGIAIDIERRIIEHNSSNITGAKYTRGRRPVHLVYQEKHVSRSSACVREYEIKRMRKKEKEILIGAS